MKGVEYIICSAIWYQDGKVRVHQPKNIISGLVVCGLRHHNCFNIMSSVLDIVGRRDLMIDCKAEIKQGFLTSNNRYVDRYEALDIAKKADQLKPDIVLNGKLYSEDIF